jgi:histidinol-phosphate phosphatase family protein
LPNGGRKSFRVNTPIYIARNSTLFLDRDGVINQRLIGDYVKRPEELILLPEVGKAIFLLNQWFRKIVLVTNQQGIGKGLMTVEDLNNIHEAMRKELVQQGAVIHEIQFCPDLADQLHNCRKPDCAMALAAQAKDPDIDFSNSVMVGDMPSDIKFGNQLGMTTVWIGPPAQKNTLSATPDAVYPSLIAFAYAIRYS